VKNLRISLSKCSAMMVKRDLLLTRSELIHGWVHQITISNKSGMTFLLSSMTKDQTQLLLPQEKTRVVEARKCLNLSRKCHNLEEDSMIWQILILKLPQVYFLMIFNKLMKRCLKENGPLKMLITSTLNLLFLEMKKNKNKVPSSRLNSSNLMMKRPVSDS